MKKIIDLAFFLAVVFIFATVFSKVWNVVTTVYGWINNIIIQPIINLFKPKQ